MIDHLAVFRKILATRRAFRYDPSPDESHLLEYQVLEAFRTRALATIAEHRKNRGPQMPELYFDYADDARVQAYAFYDRVSHVGFVAMFTGVVHLLHDMFYRMLSHPDVLPTIGRAEDETVRQPYASEGLWDDYNALLASRGRGGGRLADVIPRDPGRKRYAEILANHALDFLILHELAHITHGHCEYLQPKKAVPLLMEVNTGAPAKDPTTRQALEIAADGYACVTTWLNRLRNPTETDRTQRALLERGDSIVVVDELLMFDAVFATYIMFWMFGQSINIRKLKTANHPPPPQRATMAISHVNRLLQKKDAPEYAKEQFSRSAQKAMFYLADTLIRISNGKLEPKLKAHMEAINSGVMREHFKRVVARLRELGKELKTFAHADA